MRLGSYFTGGITAGTVRALKALIPDSNKDLGTLRNLTVTTLIADTVTAGAIGGTGTVTAGTGTETFKVGGVIEANVTQAPSAATNTTQTLMTYSLPANTLDANGRGVRVHAWGAFAANAAPKTLQLNVGGASRNTGAVTQSGSSWVIEAVVFRSAANNQKMIFKQNVGGVVLAPKSTSDTSVDTGAIVISLAGLDASAATGNILVDGLVVEYL
jgi:hypothetical protein